jgi:hypothetical protein
LPGFLLILKFLVTALGGDKQRLLQIDKAQERVMILPELGLNTLKAIPHYKAQLYSAGSALLGVFFSRYLQGFFARSTGKAAEY